MYGVGADAVARKSGRDQSAAATVWATVSRTWQKWRAMLSPR